MVTMLPGKVSICADRSGVSRGQHMGGRAGGALVVALAMGGCAVPPADVVPHSPALVLALVPDGGRGPAPVFETRRGTPVAELDSYPCTDCHDNQDLKPDPTVRKLEEHGSIELAHGGGRFWCLACHDGEKRNQLTSLAGRDIALGEGHLLCARCHFQQQRDFVYGAHGKRLDNWTGSRLLTPCSGCHDVHSPAMARRQAAAGPRLRPGLRPPEPPSRSTAPWQRLAPGGVGQGGPN